MKTLHFTKISGAGNDFLVLEDPKLKRLNLKKLTPKACDRTNGVGADGLLILGKSKTSDYKMRIINADGSEAEMCGNGVRCLASYIVRTHKEKKKIFSIETAAGEILVSVQGETALARLSDPADYRPDIDLNIEERTLHVQYIDTGVPHTIVFVDALKAVDVDTIGRTIRAHRHFKPRGTNVNFVEQFGPDLIHARTYERGVEGETKACGTGSVASAIVTYLKANPSTSKIKGATMNVKTSGGEILEVKFDIENGNPLNVWLKGKINWIAEGEYYV